MLVKDKIDEQLIAIAQQLEPTEPQRGWLTDWIAHYYRTLSEWNLIESASETLRWKIGDLIIQLENRYGEHAHTVIESIHDYLVHTMDIRITLNMLYRCARLAQIFPSNYRYRNVPYSVYQIIGEIDVGTDNLMERTRRRRLLIEAYSKLRAEQFMPVDYHAIRQFCDEYLNTLLPEGQYVPRNPRPTLPAPDDGSATTEPSVVPTAAPALPALQSEPIASAKSPVIEAEICEPSSSDYPIAARIVLETTGVQLRVELRCAKNRKGLRDLIARWARELRDYGYDETIFDTWDYA